MTYSRAIIAMHISALLWGLTGVLGALTSLDSAVVTVGRSVFAIIALSVWFGGGRIFAALPISGVLRARVLLGGFLLGAHWIFFFLSVTKGGVAIALVTYAAAAGLISAAEMLLGWSKPSFQRCIAPLLSVSGIYVMAPFNDVREVVGNEGLLYGIISCALVALVGLNGKSLMSHRKVDPLAITIGQLVGAILLASPLVVTNLPSVLTLKDLLILFVLGAFCSAVGQTLFNFALHRVPVGTGAVIANMEAPYGVALAVLFVGESITINVVVGVLLVTGSSLMCAYGPGE